MKFGEIATGDARGAVLGYSVQAGDIRLRKGQVLVEADIAALEKAGIGRIIAARLGPNDVGENEAALMLAEAVSGASTSLTDTRTGRVNIYATARGLLDAPTHLINRFNSVHESITLACLSPWHAVEPGQMIGTVKIIPLAVRQSVLNRALTRLKSGPLLQVRPFLQLRIALILTRLPSMKASVLDKSQRVIANRLIGLDNELATTVVTAHDTDSLSQAMLSLADHHDVLLVLGASAISDRSDVLPASVRRAGGKVRHLGMPVDPGNLLMLADMSGKPVIGIPSCARSPKENGFDWVLARVLAGVEVTSRDIMQMGSGGLLKEIPSRPQPRETP